MHPPSRSRRPRTASPRSREGGAAGRAAVTSRPAPASAIEAQLSPDGDPVLGLYLHIAYHTVMASFRRTVGRGDITPAIIGVLAMLAAHPGVSQATLARLMRLERATVGSTVSRAMASGFVVRRDADADARSYALWLSPAGERMVETLRRRIAAHERATGRHLTGAERSTLRTLLHKLVYG